MVGFGIVGDGDLARSGRGDDGLCVGGREAGAQAVCVIAFVGQQAGRRGAFVKERGGLRDVGVVPRGEGKGDGSPATICQGMDFGGWATTRAPDGLNLRPPFPP
jgi:hypothetical protein